MSARDEYPKAAAFADHQGHCIERWGEVSQALNRIDAQAAEIVSLREQLQAADAMRAGYDRLADYIATTGASEPDFATFLSDLMSSATAYDRAGKEPTP